MSIRKIEKKEWQDYFNTFSKTHLKDKQPEYADIQIISGSVGAQPETRWLILKGITYDEKGDLLEIELEYLKRLIKSPAQIYVDEADNGWILSFEVVENDGTTNIIETR